MTKRNILSVSDNTGTMIDAICIYSEAPIPRAFRDGTCTFFQPLTRTIVTKSLLVYRPSKWSYYPRRTRLQYSCKALLSFREARGRVRHK